MFASFCDAPNKQTTLTATHVNGSGVFQVANLSTFNPPFVNFPGTLLSVTGQVIDSGAGGTNAILKFTGNTVAGTNVIYNLTFTGGTVDQTVQAGGRIDNTASGALGDTAMNAYPSEYVDATGRNTGYPNGLASGQLLTSPSGLFTEGTGLFNWPINTGAYTLLIDGTGSVKYSINYPGNVGNNNVTVTVTNGVCSPATLTFGNSKSVPPSAVLVTELTSTPGNPIRNIQIVSPDRPGHNDNFVPLYKAARGAPFFLWDPDFLAYFQYFVTVRVMDITNINNSLLTNLASRRQPGTSWGYNVPQGFVLEWMITLANSVNGGAGADYWACIPHLATDDFITGYATLINSNLNLNLNIYVEYSNECWNTIFLQSIHCQLMGVSQFSTGSIANIVYSTGTGLCTVTTSQPHGFSNGASIQIAFASDPSYNGVVVIGNVTATTFTYTPLATPILTTASPTSYQSLMAFNTASTFFKSASSITWGPWSSSQAKVNLVVPSHGCNNNDIIGVFNASDPGFNGVFVAQFVDSNTLTINYGSQGRDMPLPAAASATTAAVAVAGQALGIVRLATASGSTPAGLVPAISTGYQWYGRQCAHVHKLFQAVIPPNRLIFTVGGQATNSNVASIAMAQYAADMGGLPLPPGPKAYGFHIGSYFYSNQAGLTDSVVFGPIVNISTITYSSPLVTVTTTTNHGYPTGAFVQIANVLDGASGGNYCGIFQITSTGLTTFTYTPINAPGGAGSKFNSINQMVSVLNAPNGREVTAIAIAGTTVTCFSAGHGFTTGQMVNICSVAAQEYDNTPFSVTEIDANNFSFQLASVNNPVANGGTRVWAYPSAIIQTVQAAADAYIAGPIVSQVAAHVALAKTYGANVNVYCYECGSSMVPSTAYQNWPFMEDIYNQASNNPYAYTQTVNFFQTLFAAGVVMATYFTLIADSVKTGNFGAVQVQVPMNTGPLPPRYAAIVYLLTPTPPPAPIIVTPGPSGFPSVSATIPITTGIVVAKSGATIMARISGPLGKTVIQSDLTEIAITLTDLATGEAIVERLSLSLSAVVVNGLIQNDPRWSKDSAEFPGPDGLWGYNFLTTIGAASILNGGDRYQADVAFTPVVGEQFRVVFQFTPVTVYG